MKTKTLVFVGCANIGERVGFTTLESMSSRGIKQLKEILAADVVFHRGDALSDSRRCVEALAGYAKKQFGYAPHFLEGDRRFGDYDSAKEILDSIGEVAEEEGWFSALRHLSPDVLFDIQTGLRSAVINSFAAVGDGQTILVVGHNPFPEALALHPDVQNGLSDSLRIRPFHGFVFQQDDPPAFQVVKVF